MVTLSDVRTPANSGPFPLKHGGEGKVPGQQPKASSAPGGAGREGGQWEEGIVLKDNSTAHPFSSWQEGIRAATPNGLTKPGFSGSWLPAGKPQGWGSGTTSSHQNSRHKPEPIQELTNTAKNIYYSCVFSAPGALSQTPDTLSHQH